MRGPLLLLAAFTASAVVLVVALGVKLARPAPAELGDPPRHMVAAEFRSSSGATLKAWLAPVSDARAVAVVMHPLRGNRRSVVGRARLLNRLGVAALIFDFQAHGESTGEWISFGHLEAMDARAAVEFARERWPGLPVIALGVSLGGAAALLSEPPLAVDGMILEAVYPDITTAVSNRLAMRLPLAELATPLLVGQLPLLLGIQPETLAPVSRADRVSVPVLVLSGSLDQRTTAADTRRLFAAFASEKRLVFFAGARHQNLHAFDSALYETEVSAFLAQLWSKMEP
jgi:alpha-beta hydrolase superfamily lysophospholipase